MRLFILLLTKLCCSFKYWNLISLTLLVHSSASSQTLSTELHIQRAIFFNPIFPEAQIQFLDLSINSEMVGMGAMAVWTNNKILPIDIHFLPFPTVVNPRVIAPAEDSRTEPPLDVNRSTIEFVSVLLSSFVVGFVFAIVYRLPVVQLFLGLENEGKILSLVFQKSLHRLTIKSEAFPRLNVSVSLLDHYLVIVVSSKLSWDQLN